MLGQASLTLPTHGLHKKGSMPPSMPLGSKRLREYVADQAYGAPAQNQPVWRKYFVFTASPWNEP